MTKGEIEGRDAMATQQQKTEGDVMAAMQHLQHFSHEHPLTLVEGKKEEEEEEVNNSSSESTNNISNLRCYGCTEKINISGGGVSYYRCEEDCLYFCLHQECAHMPITLKRSVHDEDCEGQLQLKKNLTPIHRQTCCICGQPCHRFAYACNTCDVVMDIRCVSRKGLEAKNPFHQHPVYVCFDPSSDSLCSVCGLAIILDEDHGSSCYRCDYCNFIVHPDCTPIPTSFKSPSHPHQLFLSFGYKICHICGQEVEGGKQWGYQCEECDYYIHANDCSTANLRREQIQHFSHIHPLDLVKEEALGTSSNDVEEEDDHHHHSKVQEDCHVCKQKISCDRPYYSCKRCKTYHLHKVCASLPMEIEHHQLHPKCTLKLLALVGMQCDACSDYCGDLTYHCSSCDFDLDMICAMRTHAVKKDFHPHPLIHLLTHASFRCYACGRYHSEGTSYQCTTCQFWVHEQCASLPILKETSSHEHNHNLNLIYAIPQSFWGMVVHCEICAKGLTLDHWAYFCHQCRYFIHVHDCSNPHRYDGEVSAEVIANAIHLPLPDELILDHLAANGTTISHYRHPMILFREQIEVHAIDVTPSFLNLIQGSATWPTYHVDGKDHSGFTFCTYDGKLVIQITNVDLPCYIKHEAHPHVLKRTFLNTLTWCNACENYCFGLGFRCTACAFTIDAYCALLPRKLKHGYDKHTLMLTYFTVEGVEEYVCEICEKDVIPKWFYHCVDCDQSIHARCIWQAYVEFTRVYRYHRHHCILSLVGPEEDLPKCIICNEKKTFGHGFAFQCPNQNCEFLVHLTCTFKDEVKVITEF